jgi:hypothetical protein
LKKFGILSDNNPKLRLAHYIIIEIAEYENEGNQNVIGKDETFWT